MLNSLSEIDYREWLGERIEGQTGTLSGEGRGLWSLDTESLEKLYRRLWEADPRDDAKRSFKLSPGWTLIRAKRS